MSEVALRLVTAPDCCRTSRWTPTWPRAPWCPLRDVLYAMSA
ncbi:hypothetical protein ACFQYP_31210 [Nonomuraea antimicrobica]